MKFVVVMNMVVHVMNTFVYVMNIIVCTHHIYTILLLSHFRLLFY